MTTKKTSKSKKNEPEFFGLVTIGEKGQIVIPHEARKKMNLQKGEKLIVFEAHEGMLGLTRITEIEKAAAKLSGYVKSLQEYK
jgi:AbrB family looped-hinge helix DNA binding protein